MPDDQKLAEMARAHMGQCRFDGVFDAGGHACTAHGVLVSEQDATCSRFDGLVALLRCVRDEEREERDRTWTEARDPKNAGVDYGVFLADPERHANEEIDAERERIVREARDDEWKAACDALFRRMGVEP